MQKLFIQKGFAELGLIKDKELKKIHLAYKNMKDRCYNIKNKAYSNYGGRGITVCSEWMNDRSSFVRWSIENGHSMDLSIDRVKNDEGYSPENCRWADLSTQLSNQRRYRTVNLDGKDMTIYEACIMAGAKDKSDFSRMRKRLSRYNVKSVAELSSNHLLSYRVLNRENKCSSCGITESCKWRSAGSKCNTCYCREKRKELNSAK